MPLESRHRHLLERAGLLGAVTVEPLRGGFGNDMHRITDAGGRRVVLRDWTRAPGAAPIDLRALAEAAADGIPVPQVLAEDAHSAVLSYVEGERADIVLRRSTEREREQIGEALGAAFAAVWARPRAVAGIPQVHEGEVTVEPVRPSPAAQFEDFLDRARHAPPGWSALARRYAEAMHYLGQRPVRCHGDANGKNVILHRGVGPGAAGGRWSVAAIVDWEFTWAGPLEADLGNLLRFESVFEKLSPLRRGLVRAAGVTREQVELARRLDLFAMAEMFARPRMAGPVLRQLRTVAGAQVAAGRV